MRWTLGCIEPDPLRATRLLYHSRSHRKMADFVHLCGKCSLPLYSMLDSALRLKALVKHAKQQEMPAVALTDHGNMFGAVQFHAECKKHDVKPIDLTASSNLGTDREDASLARWSTAMVVLVTRSWRWLRKTGRVKLTSLGWVEGYLQGKPRVDFDQLLAHREGLVGLSACMGGFLAQEVLQKGDDAGRAALAKLRDCFEPDAFFVELQDHGFVEQKPLNEILVGLAREFSLPLVATNDCHYQERKNAQAQMVLQCIGAVL